MLPAQLYSPKKVDYIIVQNRHLHINTVTFGNLGAKPYALALHQKSDF